MNGENDGKQEEISGAPFSFCNSRRDASITNDRAHFCVELDVADFSIYIQLGATEDFCSRWRC